MNKMDKALRELTCMDELAGQDSPLHRLNAGAKLISAIVYILPYHEPTWAAVLELKRQSVSADAYECEYGKVNAYVIR